MCWVPLPVVTQEAGFVCIITIPGQRFKRGKSEKGENKSQDTQAVKWPRDIKQLTFNPTPSVINSLTCTVTVQRRGRVNKVRRLRNCADCGGGEENA